MRKNKIGAVFLISVLALAGLGISYAGFFDDIYVYGNVSTATVRFEIMNYSDTWVFKIWGFDPANPPDDPEFPGWLVNWIPDEETLIVRGFGEYTDLLPMVIAWAAQYNVEYEREAYANAYPGGYEEEVGMYFWQVFPCINFTADVIIHYTGCIPAHITLEDFDFYPEDSPIFDYMEFHYYHYTPIYEGDVIVGWDQGNEITVFPVQMHNCEYIGIVVTIHLPQDNTLQGLEAWFYFTIHALQWNELCESVDLPPVVNIYDAENVDSWRISVSISDDYGIVSYGWLWEYDGGTEGASGTVDPPQKYMDFDQDFDLIPGTNKITFFAYDTAGQYGEDSITIII